MGVASGFPAQDGDQVVGGAFPVDEEILRAGVEEDEAGAVSGPAGDSNKGA